MSTISGNISGQYACQSGMLMNSGEFEGPYPRPPKPANPLPTPTQTLPRARAEHRLQWNNGGEEISAPDFFSTAGGGRGGAGGKRWGQSRPPKFCHFLGVAWGSWKRLCRLSVPLSAACHRQRQPARPRLVLTAAAFTPYAVAGLFLGDATLQERVVRRACGCGRRCRPCGRRACWQPDRSGPPA